MNCRVFYPNGDEELLDLSNENYIFRVSKTSHLNKIFRKVTNNKDNGVICLRGWDGINNPNVEGGRYLQVGGVGKMISWTIGDFGTTQYPTKHQFEDKVAMAYIRKPRAQFFSAKEEVGVICGHYWLTSNKSLPILLNSRILKHFFNLFQLNNKAMASIILKSLNFEGLTAQTEEEIYQHYGLTQEEINFIENEL
jgi:hypothetical protein